ncbi:MAG: hypothetical protein IPM39_29265 [Chloroflexi bacterium]|nr:hypothetical protein [Chloroflexota bacterium]
MTREKGLSNGQIERRYLLRPALPGLLTSFALMTIVLWQEIIVLEYIFNVTVGHQPFGQEKEITSLSLEDRASFYFSRDKRQAYHLVLAPFILLFLVGFAFALVGLAVLSGRRKRGADGRMRRFAAVGAVGGGAPGCSAADAARPCLWPIGKNLITRQILQQIAAKSGILSRYESARRTRTAGPGPGRQPPSV